MNQILIQIILVFGDIFLHLLELLRLVTQHFRILIILLLVVVARGCICGGGAVLVCAFVFMVVVVVVAVAVVISGGRIDDFAVVGGRGRSYFLW